MVPENMVELKEDDNKLEKYNEEKMGNDKG